MFFNILVLAIVTIILAFLIVQFFNVVFRGYAPFIPSQKKALQAAIKELSMQDDGIIYELGCGTAGFLRLAREKYNQARLIGIEYSFLPYVIAQIQNSLSKSRLQILKKNFFNVNLSDANVIYCFLNVKQMKELKIKLEKECKPGTVLISYSFSLPGKNPEKTIETENNGAIHLYKL